MYAGHSVSWREVTKKTKRGTVSTWIQATVSITEDGKRSRKTKLFNPADVCVKEKNGTLKRDEAGKLVRSDRKANAAAKRWLESLDKAEADKQAKAEEAARIAAEEEARRIAEAEKAARIAADPYANMTVREFLNEYVEFMIVNGGRNNEGLRISAIADYRTSAKMISQGIGDILVRDLTPRMVEEWLTTVRRTKAANTVSKYYRLLYGAYKRAKRYGLVELNPLDMVETAPKRETPPSNSLTPDGYRRLMATLTTMEPTGVVTAAQIACLTGARLGEIAALRWRNYDTDSKTIHIVRNIERAGGQVKDGETKTRNSNRRIPVAPELTAILERRRQYMMRELEVAGIAYDEAEFSELYVCGGTDGNFIHPTVLSRSWKALAESFGIIGTQGTRIRFHDLRHTWASISAFEGQNAKDIAATLGHSDESLVLRQYADSFAAGKRKAVDSVAALLRTPAEPYAELAN